MIRHPEDPWFDDEPECWIPFRYCLYAGATVLGVACLVGK